MNVKNLEFNELAILKEHSFIGPNSKTAPLNGFVVVKDGSTGEILVAKKNLVVRSGREETHRHLFKKPFKDSTLEMLNTRSINCFSIGKGGVISGGTLFEPADPTPSDADLTTIIPFRITDDSTILTDSEKKIYMQPVDTGLDSIQWKKKVVTATELVVDPSTDSTYTKITLDITKFDARDEYVNELGLFTSSYNPSATKPELMYTDFKMFSRITFPSEPLPSASEKSLVINYYIYN